MHQITGKNFDVVNLLAAMCCLTLIACGDDDGGGYQSGGGAAASGGGTGAVGGGTGATGGGTGATGGGTGATGGGTGATGGGTGATGGGTGATGGGTGATGGGTGATGGGSGGSGGGGGSFADAAACKAGNISPALSQACNDCACDNCLTEVNLCQSFEGGKLCADVDACYTTNITAGNCGTNPNTGMIDCYFEPLLNQPTGPCTTEINLAATGNPMGDPTGQCEMAGTANACAATTVLGTCKRAACAAECM